MDQIRTEYVMTVALKVTEAISDLGPTPYGHRRIARIAGGTFEGPAIGGAVHGGGGDWLLLRSDGVLQLDVRVTLETDDGALIYMSYRGLRHGSPEAMERMNRGEPVDPAEVYFRTSPVFETSDGRYAWMNRAIFVGSGRRLPEGPVYDVHRVL